ncbi:uncharacterized protein LOC117120721 isoform X2 [Anneissia japonica]|uniref:uncharacterized protein LOC117120721 isoform X2 n=1 Tax=Anneissia japonica TaxID=1529436 RepID=UPI0014258330|nr:uncharacterized protein LOC117120721 isoform X2 [Anneissia japonica]
MEYGSMMEASSVITLNDEGNRADSCSKGIQQATSWTCSSEKKKSLQDEISRFSAAKQDTVMKNKEPESWRIEIQEQIEQEIAQRVREALDTPPLERIRRNREKAKIRRLQQLQHANRSQSVTAAGEMKAQKAKKRAKKKYSPYRQIASTTIHDSEHTADDDDIETNRVVTKKVGMSSHFKNLQQKMSWMSHTSASSQQSMMQMISPTTTAVTTTALSASTGIHDHRYTKKEFQAFVGHQNRKNGKTKDWFQDENGVLSTVDGPFWPPEYSPILPKPLHILQLPKNFEPLSDNVPMNGRTVHNQRTKWFRPWDGSLIVYDSERSSRTNTVLDVPDGCCSSLLFESRFESGNLRQAKRVGQFEYELLLKTDLYTNRHTQWYYFRIQNMVPGVTYKFSIVNLLKRDSLYNHGMRPLLYSEQKAQMKKVGWIRCGHHIGYRRNYSCTRNPLLHPEMTYYILEWQMEFEYEDDTCYLAHCYPFTFTDLKEHIESIIADPHRGRYLKREVMCETRAGNSCFLLTISSSNGEHVADSNKKGVVITARVHPGETNSSWIMKGVIDFLTSLDQEAQELRRNFIFKIVPMLNPDGVIVGNYRCSLAARDLNRNYRNPRKESFPTVWHTKQMLEKFSRQREVLVYCDLHGHSRKHNVFIYGCDAKGTQADPGNFLCLRLFPWLMARKAPDKFTFRGCKFQVRKCKESTGRVVMWRQLGIANSFTLEATFCGSKNAASSSRHFTLKDFEELGHQFGQVILQYHTAKNNQSLHSELILEMTREITHQVLRERGMMPDQLIDYCKQGIKTDVEKESDSSSCERDLLKDGQVKVKTLIKQITEETFEGCIGILQDIDAIQEFAESETSDSDSGSESEMPASQFTVDMQTNSKSRSKKRSKNRAKSVPMLPELQKSTKQKLKKLDKSTDPTGNHKKFTKGPGDHQTYSSFPRLTPHKLIRISHVRNSIEGSLSQKNVREYWKKSQATKPSSNSGRISNGFLKPKYPAFVNRYIGRSNGGIPTYASERVGERAAKRMVSVNVNDASKKVLSKEEEEYARLVALTREIQIRTEEAPYKLADPNNLDSSTGGAMVFKQSYTHAGPGVLRGPASLAQDTTKLLSSGQTYNIESIKLQKMILNQQNPKENMILSEPAALTKVSGFPHWQKHSSSTELTEKILRPNSFIGYSKDLRMPVTNGSDVCTCFECQEVGKVSTSDSKCHKNHTHYSKSNAVPSLHNKILSQADSQKTSTCKNPLLVTNSGTLHADKSIDVIQKQYLLFLNGQSKMSSQAADKYVQGLNKGLQSGDGNTTKDRMNSVENNKHQSRWSCE